MSTHKEKEFACGGVIFRREEAKFLFLLIYSARNKVWGFPKGHIEPGETEKETALREIQEETGLTKLKEVDGFRVEDVYNVTSNRGASKGAEIEKHSIYFLFETQSADVVVDQKEITDYKWLKKPDTEKLLSHESAKKLLAKAAGYIK